MITALIKLTQDITVGEGVAIAGVADTLVEVGNVDNENVQSWKIELVYVPPGSSVVPAMLAQNPNDSEPYASFTPDTIPGSYRLILKVYTGINYTGTEDVDIRNFVLKDPLQSIVFPPYQGVPPKLPVPGSGGLGAKPDELNLEGQPYGWDGYGDEGLLLDFMRRVVRGSIGPSYESYVHQVSAEEAAVGYFLLPSEPSSKSSVSITIHEGIRQMNRLANTTEVIDDFVVIDTVVGETVEYRVHINDNGGVTELSGDIKVNDVLFVEYKKVLIEEPS